MVTHELMRESKRLRLRTRRRVDALFAGEYHGAFKGQGVEFADVRPYEPGDDVRAIDWNVTARARQPHIKRFIEERQLTINIVVDASASGLFGSQGRSMRTLAAEAAALLTLAAGLNGDRVGLLLYSDRIERHVPPAAGRNHALRVIREILGFEAEGAGTDLAAALATVHRLHPRRSITVLLTDLLVTDAALAALTRQARLAARRHEVIIGQLFDEAIAGVPNIGVVEAVDRETRRRAAIDTISRKARWRASTELTRRLERAAQECRRAGCDVLRLSTDRSLADNLGRYFRRRERRR